VYTILVIEHREPELYGNSTTFTQRRKGNKWRKVKAEVFAVFSHLGDFA
jgi:hypothetical protein